MTEQGNGKPILFKVDFSGQVRQEILALKKQAILKGIGQEFDAALHVIIQRLQANPAGFGELTRRYRKLELLVHVVSVPPLRVEFAYHEKKPFVIVKKIVMMSQ